MKIRIQVRLTFVNKNMLRIFEAQFFVKKKEEFRAPELVHQLVPITCKKIIMIITCNIIGISAL